MSIGNAIIIIVASFFFCYIHSFWKQTNKKKRYENRVERMKIVDAQNSFLKRISINRKLMRRFDQPHIFTSYSKNILYKFGHRFKLVPVFYFSHYSCVYVMYVCEISIFFSFHIFHLNNYYYYLWKKINTRKKRKLYWIGCFESIIDRVPDSFNNPKRITYMFVSYTLIMWEAFLCDSFEPNKQKKSKRIFQIYIPSQ